MAIQMTNSNSNDNHVEAIRKKYGTQNFHFHLKLHQTGIPEKYWKFNLQKLDVLQNSNYKRILEFIKREESPWTIVMDFDIDVVVQMLALVARSLLENNQKRIKWVRFLDLVNILDDKFKRTESIQKLFYNCDMVFVPNIIYGKPYHDSHDQILTLLSHIRADVNPYQLVLGLKQPPTGEVFHKYYGDLEDFFNSSHSTIFPLGNKTRK